LKSILKWDHLKFKQIYLQESVINLFGFNFKYINQDMILNQLILFTNHYLFKLRIEHFVIILFIINCFQLIDFKGIDIFIQSLKYILIYRCNKYSSMDIMKYRGFFKFESKNRLL
jgi:hypothetical protein